LLTSRDARIVARFGADDDVPAFAASPQGNAHVGAAAA